MPLGARTQLEALDRELGVIEPSEHEDGELGVPIERLGQKLDAFHAGELDI